MNGLLKLKKIDLLSDIYYQKEYASLNLNRGSTLFEFDYREGSYRFYNLSVKKPITYIGNYPVADKYYDLETAYGYGGYYSSTEDPVFLKNAISAYSEQCEQERIVAEFVRFHPYNTFPEMNKEYLDFMLLDRQTVSIDLNVSKEDRWSKYSGTTRNILRKSKPSMAFHETVDIDGFMQMYQQTMEKNNANSFYYFPKEYYQELLAMPNIKLFIVEVDSQVINMSFVLFGSDLAHYHLSANNINFAKLNGNYCLLDFVCDYTKKYYPDISQLHLGGGRSNQDNDSLLAFKAKFSHIRNNFYIAGKIFNHAVYQQYTDTFNSLYPELKSAKFFLKYRLDMP